MKKLILPAALSAAMLLSLAGCAKTAAETPKTMADGTYTAEMDDASAPMDPAPSAWMPELNDQLLKSGGSGEIDGVTGATLATNNAKAMMKAILDSGVAGETVVVSEPTAG